MAIVQARVGSSRLPNKIFAAIAGETMLARVVERLRVARTIDRIVIATTTGAADDPVIDEAARLEVDVFRGPEADVLARYLGAARETAADVIVRVTSDCPLLDATVVDDVVGLLAIGDCDYASNTQVRSFPRGLDVEAFPRDVLERMARLARSPAAREHVTAYVLEEHSRFIVRQLVACDDDSDLRWTVDTEDDLALVRTLYDRLPLTVMGSYRALVAAVRTRPELAVANAHVVQQPTFAEAR